MHAGCSPFGGIPRNWKLEKDPNVIKKAIRSPFGGIPRNWKLLVQQPACLEPHRSSPFGGIPRNWKLTQRDIQFSTPFSVPPSGGSLEIGNTPRKQSWVCLGGRRSPFGGIPRNWKLQAKLNGAAHEHFQVPPSGGSLEIGNAAGKFHPCGCGDVPPSGGSLEIGNKRKPATQ